MTTHPPTDCRECRAGRLQAQNAAVAYFCREHGYQEYVPGDRIRELEGQITTLERLAVELVRTVSTDAKAELARRVLEQMRPDAGEEPAP